MVWAGGCVAAGAEREVTMRRIVFGSVLLVTLTAGAQPSACRQQGDIHVCQADGYGTIINNDLAQAKDEAVIDAQRKSLEQVAGVQAAAGTIRRNRGPFDQPGKPRPGGGVRTDQVLTGRGGLPHGQ